MSTNDEPSEIQGPPQLWNDPSGDVPAVKPEDLKIVWELFADSEARTPGQSVSIGDSVYRSVCSTGADVFSVWYRVSMLAAVIRMRPDPPERYPLTDSVFEVAATIPMARMPIGFVRDELPFDVDGFMKRIEKS
jgi:hypothetical protein